MILAVELMLVAFFVCVGALCLDAMAMRARRRMDGPPFLIRLRLTENAYTAAVAGVIASLSSAATLGSIILWG